MREGVEDLRPGRIEHLARTLLGAQEVGQRTHVGAFQVIAQARLPGGLQADAFGLGGFAHAPSVRSRRCLATRNWNSSLVTSSFSSTGFSTRSLAPARSNAAWLAGFSSPVITSTGS